MASKYPSAAKMLKKQQTVKARVKDILEKYPTCRGDYRLLQYRYLRKFTGVKMTFDEFEQLRQMPSPETIGRRKRELQNEFPDLRPLEATQQKREILEEATRNYYSKGNTLIDYMG